MEWFNGLGTSMIYKRCFYLISEKIFVFDVLRIRFIPYSILTIRIYNRDNPYSYMNPIAIRVRIRIRAEIWKQIWYQRYPFVSDPFSSLGIDSWVWWARSDPLRTLTGSLNDFGDWVTTWSIGLILCASTKFWSFGCKDVLGRCDNEDQVINISSKELGVVKKTLEYKQEIQDINLRP